MLSRRHVIAAAALAATAARAQTTAPGLQSSAWVKAPSSYARLLAPVAVAPGEIAYAALELRLDAGAKTYWRSPGDTGVPPVASFAASRGVEAAALEFPAPVAFDDGAGGIAIGYLASVVFPIRFQATAAKPRLAITFDYGVCLKNLCIPAQIALALDIAGAAPEPELAATMAAARGRVPPVRLLGAAQTPAILSVAASAQNGAPALEIVARIGAGTETPTLFIEHDTAFAVSLIAREGEAARFRALPQGGAPGLPTGEARLTLIIGEAAVESRVSLPAAR